MSDFIEQVSRIDHAIPHETRQRDSAFGVIEERPRSVVRNPDGSVTYHRVPRTVVEGIQMIKAVDA